MAVPTIRTCPFPYLALSFVALSVATRPPTPDGQAGRNLRLQPVSLSDISSESRSSGLKVKKKQGRVVEEGPIPSGWFGDFSQAESTYTAEGLDSSKDNPIWSVKHGRDPALTSPLQHSEVLKSEFFHESRSGGPTAAWQTHYPSVPSNIAGNAHSENPWRYTPEGWVQDYVADPAGSVSHSGADPYTLAESVVDAVLERRTGAAPASWFDNSVRQVDGYGRQKTPTSADGRFYSKGEGWLERSTNTTVTCKEVGCVARSTLQLYDAAKEEASSCHVSIHMHPTDYDDDFSREIVEYWSINNYTTSRSCNPRARGCNATAERPLYPCLSEFNVDSLIDDKGSIVLEGKNSKMVDECPHNGNLLSAVAVSTCMVRDKPKITSAPPSQSLFGMDDLHSEAVLKCDTPGCTAETKLYFNPGIALNGGKCKLRVNVTQTDYDDDLGLGNKEELVFIALGNQNLTTKPLPEKDGKNPCTAEYQGKSLTDSEKFFEAVKDHDVTDLIKSTHPLGVFKIAGKISDQVDECAKDGNLLYATVHMDCEPPKDSPAKPSK